MPGAGILKCIVIGRRCPANIIWPKSHCATLQILYYAATNRYISKSVAVLIESMLVLTSLVPSLP